MLTNAVYYHRHLRFKTSDYIWLTLLMVIGLALAFIGRQSNLGLVAGLMVASLSQCIYLIQFHGDHVN